MHCHCGTNNRVGSATATTHQEKGIITLESNPHTPKDA